jgi:flavin reductase (DIM6/NTAB) family NADH-FMN oxidoreductase RutF
MSVTDEVFRRALSRLAAGVSIISTCKDDDRRGVTATAVCSVSASPPTILACVNTATGTCKMIEEVGRFAVNLLAEHHRPVAEAFAGRGGLQGDERFVHGDWVSGEGGLPVLETSLAALECRVDHMVIAGTHAVFFGIVEKVAFAERTPLIFHEGSFHILPGREVLREVIAA